MHALLQIRVRCPFCVLSSQFHSCLDYPLLLHKMPLPLEILGQGLGRFSCFPFHSVNRILTFEYHARFRRGIECTSHRHSDAVMDSIITDETELQMNFSGRFILSDLRVDSGVEACPAHAMPHISGACVTTFCSACFETGCTHAQPEIRG